MACSSKIEPNTELSFNLDTAETLKITSDFDNEGTLILKVKNFEGGNYKILLVSKDGNNKNWITEEIKSDVEFPVEPWRYKYKGNIIDTIILEDNDDNFRKIDIYEDGTEVESGIVTIPPLDSSNDFNITPFAYTGSSWDRGTCYAIGRGIYVYKEIGGNRIQFIADVDLINPSCGTGTKIVRGYDITLNKKLGGYFTHTSNTRYTAYHSGYSVSLYVGGSSMWTD